MKLITLTSDWTLHEPYVGMLKGTLLTQFPDANVVDITHSIELANVNQTAFMLRSAYRSFPEGTVHFILTGVSPLLLSQPVVLSMDGHFFIGDDTGVFSLLSYGLAGGVARQYVGEEGTFIQKMVRLAEACFDGSWEGCTADYSLQMRIPFTANYIETQNMISGHIIYIDAYNNVLTDIPVALFEEKVRDGRFTARIDTLTITHLHRTYEQDTEPYMVPNSLGVMEIATYKSRVSILAKWQKDTSVDVYCYRINS